MINHKSKWAWVVLIGFVLSNASLGGVKAKDNSNNNYSALLLVANSYGDNYYDIVGNFTQWGWKIETAGIVSSVRGCDNHHPASYLHCNLTFNDLDESTLKMYDCLIIPSGGHWHSLVAFPLVSTIIKTAHENGLIIGTLCIGQKVLSNIEGFMDGVRVASYSQTISDMQRENAVLVYESVVSDNGIVTGGGGGGFSGGGYTVAPTVEFCESVKIAIEERNEEMNKSLTVKILLFSVGGVMSVTIGTLGIKFRHKIFKKNEEILKKLKK